MINHHRDTEDAERANLSDALRTTRWDNENRASAFSAGFGLCAPCAFVVHSHAEWSGCGSSARNATHYSLLDARYSACELSCILT